ncbi:uncharacterized protein TRUGW13939_09772 [Talaromyces rugulosus]|uniref:Rad60/SUMO-like domain-containing protein n=1 Tax=Talaromyces rugulosus TaxID=121627 RepID=A0A7H8RA40_TALRU|nr:uncharacterized protein TRUGW13939_09772 [Talaromyces rugulosus]QKX62611.1 hypothetical protein TRUGW13939_09772 [Talaromyces rugulosus]
MRSFFNKPAWAAAGDESNTADFYRRSKQTYGDIIAANRQQHRAATTTPDPPSDRGTAKPAPKRRRVTRRDDQPSDDSTTNSLNGDLDQGTGGNDNDDKGIVQESAQGNGEIVTLKSPTITALPPSDENAAIAIASSPESTNSTKLHDSYDSNSANEKADSPLGGKRPLTNDESHNNESRNNNTSRANSSRPPEALHSDFTKDRVPEENDEIVQIFVSSAIKNTRPLLVHRRISQRFRDVRVTWCERQGFDNKMTSSVYLTWNKRRLFDVTTCRSLGVKGASSPIYDTSQFEDETSPGNEPLRIHVEAVTDELLQSQADETLHSSSKLAKSEVKPEPSFSIALRSRDYEEIWIKVRKRTKVSQILNDFRARASVPSDTNIQLSFDGDILDPASRLEAHDIAEDDLVEVLFR